MVFSEKLDRKVYTLKDWIEKSVFKKYKKLFGYTDIGWTVKHPKQLCRSLIDEKIWEVDENEFNNYLSRNQEVPNNENE